MGQVVYIVIVHGKWLTRQNILSLHLAHISEANLEKSAILH